MPFEVFFQNFSKKITDNLTFSEKTSSNKRNALQTKSKGERSEIVGNDFETEYAKIEKSLYLTAISWLRSTEDAKDALQEAAISAYLGYEKLRSKEHFKTWMTRIVINKCKDFIKSRRYTEELTDGIGAFDGIPISELELADAISGLGNKKSVYITLRFYMGLNYEETAKVLGISVSTVKYRTAKALEELKKALEVDGK